MASSRAKPEAIPPAPDPAPSAGPALLQLAPDVIDVNPNQPRSTFDRAALEALARSIEADGIMQPLVVRARGERYELIAGERRLRAAKHVGLECVPAVLREADDRGSAELALIENLLREDLNPIERAEGLRGLIDQFGETQQGVADRLGMDRSSVSNLLRLLELEPEIRDMLSDGSLSLGHGKALLSMSSGEGRLRLAERARDEPMSVRSLESAAKGDQPPTPQANPGAQSQAPERSPALVDLEKQLGEHLGTKVRLKTDSKGIKGRIEVDFYSIEHFDGLVSQMGFRLSEH
ncbi:MAG: ParB/RepB/Spo0J family partition protein [Planctomycetota bacterium]